MKLTLKYPKELCIFELHQTPPYVDLACPQVRKDPHGKINSKTKCSHLSKSFQFQKRLEK